MVQAISIALPGLEQVRKEIRGIRGTQIFSKQLREQLHKQASNYFSEVRPTLAAISGLENEIAETDTIFQELLALSRKNPSKEKCSRLLKAARDSFVRLEGASITRPSTALPEMRTDADSLILESLQEICPSAALAYDQALKDLASTQRSSYRGPATDLREALRETLDTLAPDTDVESMPVISQNAMLNGRP